MFVHMCVCLPECKLLCISLRRRLPDERSEWSDEGFTQWDVMVRYVSHSVNIMTTYKEQVWDLGALKNCCIDDREEC